MKTRSEEVKRRSAEVQRAARTPRSCLEAEENAMETDKTFLVSLTEDLQWLVNVDCRAAVDYAVSATQIHRGEDRQSVINAYKCFRPNGFRLKLTETDINSFDLNLDFERSVKRRPRLPQSAKKRTKKSCLHLAQQLGQSMVSRRLQQQQFDSRNSWNIVGIVCNSNALLDMSHIYSVKQPYKSDIADAAWGDKGNALHVRSCDCMCCVQTQNCTFFEI